MASNNPKNKSVAYDKRSEYAAVFRKKILPYLLMSGILGVFLVLATLSDLNNISGVRSALHSISIVLSLCAAIALIGYHYFKPNPSILLAGMALTGATVLGGLDLYKTIDQYGPNFDNLSASPLTASFMISPLLVSFLLLAACILSFSVRGSIRQKPFFTKLAVTIGLFSIAFSVFGQSYIQSHFHEALPTSLTQALTIFSLLFYCIAFAGLLIPVNLIKQHKAYRPTGKPGGTITADKR